jgi:chromosome segregation and condensation protein ScpB
MTDPAENADQMRAVLDALAAEFDRAQHGPMLRVVAGGYRLVTRTGDRIGVPKK